MRRELEVRAASGGTNAPLWSDEHRKDQACALRLEGTEQRHGIDWVDHCGAQRRVVACGRAQMRKSLQGRR